MKLCLFFCGRSYAKRNENVTNAQLKKRFMTKWYTFFQKTVAFCSNLATAESIDILKKISGLLFF